MAVKTPKEKLLDSSEVAYAVALLATFKKSRDDIKAYLIALDEKGMLNRANMSRFNRMDSFSKYINVRLNDVYELSAKSLDKIITDAYQTSYNYSLFEVDSNTNYSTSPITLAQEELIKLTTNQLDPVGYKERNRLMLLAAAGILSQDVLRGIFQNYAYRDLSKIISNSFDVTFNKSLKVLTTEAHWAIEKADFDNIIKLKDKLGVSVQKKWDSIIDAVTRDPHRGASGQTVDYDSFFVVGGELLQYPGDSAASAWNRINCRCSMRTVFDGRPAEQLFDKNYPDWLRG